MHEKIIRRRSDGGNVVRKSSIHHIVNGMDVCAGFFCEARGVTNNLEACDIANAHVDGRSTAEARSASAATNQVVAALQDSCLVRLHERKIIELHRKYAEASPSLQSSAWLGPKSDHSRGGYRLCPFSYSRFCKLLRDPKKLKHAHLARKNEKSRNAILDKLTNQVTHLPAMVQLPKFLKPGLPRMAIRRERRCPYRQCLLGPQSRAYA